MKRIGKALSPLALAAPVILALLACSTPPGQVADSPPEPLPSSILPIAPKDPFVGSWRGALSVGGTSIDLVLDIGDEDAQPPAGLDVPSQGARGIPAAKVERLPEGRLRVDLSAIKAVFEATLAEGELRGFWLQGGSRLPLVLRREAAQDPAQALGSEIPRPGSAAKGGQAEGSARFRSLELRLPGGSPGVELAGSLLLPEGDGPFPLAVLVSGSGPQDRDESIMGKRPLGVLAEALAARGVASFRYDDRGVAASSGDFAAATTYDFAADALAALSAMGARPEARPGAVGIVGHSEGGLVAFLLAGGWRPADEGRAPAGAAAGRDPAQPVDSPLPAFAVALAGPVVSGEELLLLQSAAIMEASGAPAAAIATTRALNSRLYALARGPLDPAGLMAKVKEEYLAFLESAGVPEAARPAALEQAAPALAPLASPWFRAFLALDPRPGLAAASIPVLALFGDLDLQVPAAPNLAAFEALVPAAPNLEARVLPRHNHLFQVAERGLPEEYGRLPGDLSAEASGAVADWILAATGKR